MWVLILTMTLQAKEPAASMVAVPGFYSQADCMLVGNEWMRQQDRMQQKRGGGFTASALCAQAGEKK